VCPRTGARCLPAELLKSSELACWWPLVVAPDAARVALRNPAIPRLFTSFCSPTPRLSSSAAAQQLASLLAPTPAMVPIRATKKEIHPLRPQSDDSGKHKDSAMHDATKALDDKPKRKRQSQSTYELPIFLVLLVLHVLSDFLHASYRVHATRPHGLARSLGPLALLRPSLDTDRDTYPQAVTRAGPARCDVHATIQTTKRLAASTASVLVSHVHTNTSPKSAVLQICSPSRARARARRFF